MLDPGHDASETGDTGATAADGITEERVVNLEIANMISERLKQFGITYIKLTRTNNNTIQNIGDKITELEKALVDWKPKFKGECENFRPYFISIRHNEKGV